MSQNANLNKAFKFFREKKFEKASENFARLEADEKVPSWIKLRINQFHKIAEAQMAVNDQEDDCSLKIISYYMNLGEYEKADKILEEWDAPAGEKAYLRAEMAIEQDDSERAISYLEEAIEANACNRGYALNSPSFAPFLKSEAFEFLREKEF